MVFSCAQSMAREHKAKVPKGGKPRDARRMERFDCSGWLYIAVQAASDVMSIKISHKVDHLPYADISIPDRWKQYIEEHAGTETSGVVRIFLNLFVGDI